MIKANELRIGNILYSNLTERNFICNSEDIYNLAMDYNANNANYVELTEEWLLKFGFEKISNKSHSDYYLLSNTGMIFGIDKNNYNGLFHYCFMKDASLNFVPIHFIHQLQNLYFALTGEELTIKNS